MFIFKDNIMFIFKDNNIMFIFKDNIMFIFLQIQYWISGEKEATMREHYIIYGDAVTCLMPTSGTSARITAEAEEGCGGRPDL